MGKGQKQLLTEEQQRKYLLGKIGEPVEFDYPEPQLNRSRTLKDRVIHKAYEDDDVVYWDLMDYIEVVGEQEFWLRMTYYRYKKKEIRWVFAGQTSFSGPIGLFQEFFIKCIKEKQWVRPLFKRVYDSCEKELG